MRTNANDGERWLIIAKVAKDANDCELKRKLRKRANDGERGGTMANEGVRGRRWRITASDDENCKSKSMTKIAKVKV